MSISFCRFFSFLLLFSASLSAHSSVADAPTVRSPQGSPGVSSPQTPPQTYDQIVRLSFVQGDVRISRGKEAKHATGGDWGQAAAGIPLETGFSLATGKGRAEIEFEDASTVYLGDDSVLIFNELTTTGGVPHTDATLLSGTATLNVRGRALSRGRDIPRPSRLLRGARLSRRNPAGIHAGVPSEKSHFRQVRRKGTGPTYPLSPIFRDERLSR